MEIKEFADHYGYHFVEYIGDSVYVAFDGYHYWLMTWNGYPDDPRNKIALEPSVYSALTRWVDGLADRCDELSKGEAKP